MGQVLIRFDIDCFLDRLSLEEPDRTTIKRNVFSSLEWARLDRGSLTEEEAFRSMCSRLPQRLHETALTLVTMWDQPVIPVDGMEALLASLRKNGYRIFLLSNASCRQHEYWPRIPGSQYFDDTLISADVALVKPQPEIYRLALRKFHILPEESLFIDDVPLNVEGAFYAAGIEGFVFHNDIEELRLWLQGKGVCTT